MSSSWNYNCCAKGNSVRLAAFQINMGDGTVHLVCVPTASFRTACDLESWLGSHVNPQCSVIFLGRYDYIQTFTTLAEAKTLIMDGSTAANALGTVVSIEDGAKKFRSRQ